MPPPEVGGSVPGLVRPDLVAETARLIAIASPSFAEGPLADWLEQRLRATGRLEVTRIGDNVVARTRNDRDHRLLLVGHTDTVPADGNEAPVVIDDRVRGLGACDMKGGLAVLVALAETIEVPAMDVTWVFYAREEVAAQHNGLAEVLAARPDLLAGDAAVLGEPTSADIEAGCQGTLRVRATWHGTRAHTARPWMGVNAIHRMGAALTRLDAHQARRPVIGGCEYREAMQAVGVEGGVAGNVVPDRATLVVNHRYAPDRDLVTASDAVRAVLDADEIEVVDNAPAAPPSLDHPLLASLVERAGLALRAKLGWTDVARFAELGVPALNLGPGDATLAHTRDEWVDRAQLDAVYDALATLLTYGPNR